MKTEIVIVSVLCVGLAFLATDNYDSDGHPTWVSEPEQWHVDCLNLDNKKLLDCNTTKTKYYSITNDACVTVQSREGRFTGIQWNPRLDL